MLEITEVDEVGRITATYISSFEHGPKGHRIDLLPAENRLPLSQRLLSVFLPSGYPHSVTADYTTYQIYDSLQAFSSSIASLLASRAVLQGIGVGDENASATAAILLNILQESVGRVATILFAHWCSRSMEAEVKVVYNIQDHMREADSTARCIGWQLTSSMIPPCSLIAAVPCFQKPSALRCSVLRASSAQCAALLEAAQRQS